MRKKHKWVLYALLIQPVLIMLQIVLIYVFKIPEESTTIYRVLLTAIPMSLAIIILAKERPFFLIVTYAVTIVILLLNCLIFPHNQKYIIEGSTRFLLPIVIPSALCLLIGITIEQFENILYKVSWVVFSMAIFFCVCYYIGIAYFNIYDMSLGYALLLPMVSLYSRKRLNSVIGSIVLLLIVMSLGSRGPAYCFLIYVIYDVLVNNRKWIILLVLLFLIFITMGPELISYLNFIGIKARTLELLFYGDAVSSSGRDYLYESIWTRFEQYSGFLGLGLFGDRSETVVYCHNIIIEIIIGWGWILGLTIITTSAFLILRLFIGSNNINRNRLIKYLCALVIPFFASSSYLIDYRIGLFIGLFGILYKQTFNKKIVKFNS